MPANQADHDGGGFVARRPRPPPPPTDQHQHHPQAINLPPTANDLRHLQIMQTIHHLHPPPQSSVPPQPTMHRGSGDLWPPERGTPTLRASRARRGVRDHISKGGEESSLEEEGGESIHLPTDARLSWPANRCTWLRNWAPHPTHSDATK